MKEDKATHVLVPIEWIDEEIKSLKQFKTEQYWEHKFQMQRQEKLLKAHFSFTNKILILKTNEHK